MGRPLPPLRTMIRSSFLIPIAFAAIVVAPRPARAEAPRAEHPRPDLQRENWMTLNGEWQFEINDKAEGDSRGLSHGRDLADRIIGPFRPESKLSGIGPGEHPPAEERPVSALTGNPDYLAFMASSKLMSCSFGAPPASNTLMSASQSFLPLPWASDLRVSGSCLIFSTASLAWIP
jgi:hypothetical protein